MSKSQTDNGTGNRPPASVANEQADILQFLSTLRGEIDDLKREQREHPPMSRQHELLTSLRQDLTEADPAAQPGGQAGELNGVMAGLRREVSSITHEAPRATDQQLVAMLAELRKGLDELKHEQAVVHVPAREQQLYAVVSGLRRDIASLKKAQGHNDHAGEASQLDGIMSGLRQDLDHSGRRSGPQRTSPSGSRTKGIDLSSIVVGLAFAALAANAYIMMLPTTNTAAPSQPKPASSTLLSVDFAGGDGPLYSALALPPESPLGLSGDKLGADEALSRAGTILSSSASDRNSEEAGYWLKRYLVASQASKGTPRMLTQLGSLYADGIGGAPADHRKARQLWEMSSALGDSVAMCFLGRLFENGITAPASSTQASVWYLRARNAGGCPGLDEALLRTRATR